LSVTRTKPSPRSVPQSMVSRPPGSVYLTALWIKLHTHWISRTGSPWTIAGGVCAEISR